MVALGNGSGDLERMIGGYGKKFLIQSIDPGES